MKATVFLQKLQSLKSSDLESIKGIGPILSQNIIDFLNSARFQIILEKFKYLESTEKGLDLQLPVTKTPTKGKLSGQIICITGSFDKSRDEIRKEIETFGGQVTNTINSKTTILLVGDKPGSKLAKAEKLGINIENSLKSLFSRFEI